MLLFMKNIQMSLWILNNILFYKKSKFSKTSFFSRAFYDRKQATNSYVSSSIHVFSSIFLTNC